MPAVVLDVHQHEVLPGSGHVNESGRGAGEDLTISVLMPGIHINTVMQEFYMYGAQLTSLSGMSNGMNLCAVPPGHSACPILLSNAAWTPLCPPGPLCASSAAQAGSVHAMMHY